MFEKDTALVVDDAQQIVTLVTRMLKERLKFGRVLGVTDSKEAVELLKNEQINWVISDWEMPNISGIELLRLVRANPNIADIPFILMSTRADKESLVEAVTAGVSDYITKPFSPAKLDEKLRRFIHLQERRTDIRVAPTDKYICEIEALDGKKYNSDLINISISGVLVKVPMAREGIYLFDKMPLMLRLYEANLKLTAEVVRMDTSKDGDDYLAKLMTVAFKFDPYDNEARVVLTQFINKYKINIQ